MILLVCPSIFQLLASFAALSSLPFSSSLGNSPLSLMFFLLPNSTSLFAPFHLPFQSCYRPVILLSRDSSLLSFNPSVSCLLGWNPTIFQDLNSLQRFSHPWVPVGSGLQQFISLGPILCLAYPEHFLHHIRTSPSLSILLTRSWSPKCRLLSFPNLLTRISVLYISWHLKIFASSSTSHTTILVCFRTPLCSMLRFLALPYPRKFTFLSA